MNTSSYFGIIIPSLALSVALYTFLSNNTKFREFSKKFWSTVMLQLCSMVCCSTLLLLDRVQKSFSNNLVLSSIFKNIGSLFEYGFLLLYLFSWLYLCKVFYSIFGSLYHLRKKRFIKYTKPVAWFYEKFIHKVFYEKNYRPRQPFLQSPFAGVEKDVFQRIVSGGSILFLYDDVSDCSTIITNFIRDTISNDETIDYITTYKSPVVLCKEYADNEIVKVSRYLSIIDCFTSHYGFDDKVMKFAKRDLEQKGFIFYNAATFADIHTAANDSWYRFRKVCQGQENSYRIPHRTIYDTVSSLIRFSSEEQYVLFLRHVLSSEKSYGMISVIMEPQSLKAELKNDLIHMTDVVLEYNGSQVKLIK